MEPRALPRVYEVQTGLLARHLFSKANRKGDLAETRPGVLAVYLEKPHLKGQRRFLLGLRRVLRHLWRG